uniref:peptidylprolyl isomerase n=1 Tax=Gouania willdenowi TaxID=441366 RepID=A0A8C5E1R0_GOUWI
SSEDCYEDHQVSSALSAEHLQAQSPQESYPPPPADEWLDVFGNGILKKKVLQAGGGRDSRPQNGQMVTINLKTRLLDGTLVEELPEFSFTLGDGEMIPALDVAVQLMGMGEKALIDTDVRYAYITRRNPFPQIPSRAELEVELLEATDPPDLKLLSLTEMIALATYKMERGNLLYRCVDYDYAIFTYDITLQIADSISKADISSEEENKLMEVKVKCLNKIAAIFLKLDQYDEALECCSKALTYQPENVKALFHMGKVLALQDKYSEAIQTLQKALELEPHNNTVRNEFSKLVQTHEAAKQAKYEKMLGNPSSTHKQKAKSACDLSWKWLLVGTAVAIGGIALSVAIYARR